MSEPTCTSAPRRDRVVFAVLAQVRGGVDYHFLAAYSSRDRAREFIMAQDAELQQNLVVWEVELDAHPSDPYWTAPQGGAGAFHALAGLPEDALPVSGTTGDGHLPTLDEVTAYGRFERLESRLADAEKILHQIAVDRPELSYDKVRWQATDHQRNAAAYFDRHHGGGWRLVGDTDAPK